MARHQSSQIHLLARVVDIDPRQVAFGVVIQADSLEHFTALHARTMPEIAFSYSGMISGITWRPFLRYIRKSLSAVNTTAASLFSAIRTRHASAKLIGVSL